MPDDNPDRRTLVFVVPRDTNPYQEQLYAPMRAAHRGRFSTLYWRRRPWIGLPGFFVTALWAAARGSRLAHVHWMAWDVRLDIPFRKTISGVVSRAALWWLRALRFRIVWTVHNIVPHEEQTDDDRRFGQQLAASADAIITHSPVISDALAALGFPTRSVTVIPQGSYVGLYGPPPSRGAARRALRLPGHGRTVLFFGLIRPYKGIPELLRAWSELDSKGTLVIAGSCPDETLRAVITDAADTDATVEADLRFIPDDAVATYFAAADAICLPFRGVTTSSSAMLALSLATPLIAPRLGALADLPDDVGFFYGGDTGLTLADALRCFFAAPDSQLSDRAAHGRAHAASTPWSTVAERTYGLYAEVLGHPPAEQRLPALSRST